MTEFLDNIWLFKRRKRNVKEKLGRFLLTCNSIFWSETQYAHLSSRYRFVALTFI